MQKVARAKEVALPVDLVERLATVPDVEALQALYELGLSEGWMSDQVRALFTARKSELKVA
jgi:metal-sulfur cluster biosynthetic enzyme